MLTLPLILAAVSAGLIGGFHCVGMCGGIANMLSRLPQFVVASTSPSQKIIAIVPESSSTPISTSPSSRRSASVLHSKSRSEWFYQCQLHAGRISTYMIIGAIFGGFGAVSLRWKTDLPISPVLFLIGNLALIFLALRLLGVRLFGEHLRAMLPAFISDKIQNAYAILMPTIKRGSDYPFWMGMTWGALPCGLSYAVAPFALLSGLAWSGAALMLIFGIAALPHLLIAQSLSQGLKRQAWMRVIQVLLAVSLLGLGLMGIFYFDMKNMPDFLCITPRY